jgi:GAF domain-containing protein
MEKTQLTVAELSSLLRMIQVIPDADNVARIQQVLLAFCTAWRTIGVRRAFFFVVDERGRAVRGHLAAERAADDEPGAEPATFEALARRVVDTTQQIDTNDLTLRTRAFTVPLDWLRCGIAKAVDSGMPALADRRLTEFASDPFFDFFQTPAYVAVPLRVRGRITAVLVADNGEAGEAIGLEDISLVYSMSQQAATAIERLLDSTDNSRKFRVLRKLQDVLASAEDSRRFGDSLSAVLSMTARAAGGTGALLKDLVRNKTTHVKSVDDIDATDRDIDISITESFEEILDRVAGSTRQLRGDSGHALLSDAAAGAVQHFVALPLLAGGDCLGAVAVYSEANGAGTGVREFSARDRLFLELCAGMLAERLDSLYKADRLRRSERMLEEAQSNWIREKMASRAAARALEQYNALVARAQEIRQAVDSRSAFEKRVERVREIMDRVESEAEAFRVEAEAAASELELVDVFTLAKEMVEAWATKLRAAGVEVTIRIPDDGPTLLMHRASVRGALDSVVQVLAEHVGKGDRVLFECTVSEQKAVLLFADTAGKVDGTLLSRLFLPFAPRGQSQGATDTMAMAGDILQRHAGEITVKSSASWKTILAITFPISANRDRRNTRSDRRRRPRDRRDRS